MPAALVRCCPGTPPWAAWLRLPVLRPPASLAACAFSTALPAASRPSHPTLTRPAPAPTFLSPQILNLAVGGPGTVFTGGAALGSTLAQPQLMMVDWVRVHGLPFALSRQQLRR